jgi:aspartate aminotransferase-like enzyme
MASERYAKFLKEFGPRVTELLDRLQKAAGVSERPMTSGDLDILAAASWELLTTTLANMPEPQRGRRARRLSETLTADVAKKRERLEQKIRGRLDALRGAPPED